VQATKSSNVAYTIRISSLELWNWAVCYDWCLHSKLYHSLSLNSVRLRFCLYFACLCIFSFAMITYSWCEQSRALMMIPLCWTGADSLLGVVLVFGPDSTKPWDLYLRFSPSIITLIRRIFLWCFWMTVLALYTYMCIWLLSLLFAMFDHDIMFYLILWKTIKWDVTFLVSEQ